MSSSYIVETEETKKKDDTLIIVVDDDGTISVDQETLQNMILNQTSANVSVVRVGQADGENEKDVLTFTVDPPNTSTPEVTTAATTTPTSTTPMTTTTTTTSQQSGATDGGLVDPFMQMDPEQLERLETALQSEQAKQILGANVTAMLDMLTVEDEQNSMRYSIDLDHCYTSRTSPMDPEPLDPLPVANSPVDVDSSMKIVDSLQPQIRLQQVQPVPQPAEDQRIQTPKLPVKKPVGRPRKSTTPIVLPSSTAKTPQPTTPTGPGTITQESRQQSPRLSVENNNDDDDHSSLSDSTESGPSDDDSDFGPRGPRRVRARGGRRGLTTRGGTMTGRRGRPNKQMDNDQVRRLNIEMAAAVDAMKTSGKTDNLADNTVRVRKGGIKTMGGKKKEDLSLSTTATIPSPPTTTITTAAAATETLLPQVTTTVPTQTPIVTADKPLQTTNQVKANLISANMIKGDMILTKPGQSRNNQKVFILQKKILVKPGELKTISGKKPSSIVLTKGPIKFGNPTQMKLTTSEDGKLITVPIKTITSEEQQGEHDKLGVLGTTDVPVKQISKIATVTSPVKIKTVEGKKDRKKSESEVPVKVDEQKKLIVVDNKTPELNKKHVKKEVKKSPAVSAVALGPALFSTPDIIRRVGSIGDAKAPEILDNSSGGTTTTTTTTTTSENKSNADDVMTAMDLDEHLLPIKTDFTNIDNDLSNNYLSVNSTNIADTIKQQTGELMDIDDENQQNIDPKHSHDDDLHSALDPGGIEGEEHLLATLAMEAANKHEDELLAEALLLQELDVDLTDPSALDEANASLSESLLSPSVFESAILPPTSTVPAPMKSPETVKQIISPPAIVPPTLVTATAATTPLTSRKKDQKEPIQIVRGGRVITLPPIEAPATRSKRLQVKPESPKSVKLNEIINRKEEKEIKSPKQLLHIPPQQQQQQQQQQVSEMESEMEDDDEGDNSDSEDDPNRLWCICKRPHNNRFMICCDLCEDWFHGKCVNISKAMGKQMEEQGIEWVCPNCKNKRKSESGTSRSPARSTKSPAIKVNKIQNNLTQQDNSINEKIIVKSTTQQTQQCVVCKNEVKNTGIYCSDECIIAHAKESSGKQKSPVSSPVQKQQSTNKLTNDLVGKNNQENRIIVFERKSGKVLSGNDAPTAENLNNWLKEHPTFEQVMTKNFNTVQIGSGKTVATIQTKGNNKLAKLQSKNQGQPKMIYTKISGSKQTVLAASHKKVSSPIVQNKQIKHVVVSTPVKSQSNLKQTTIKTIAQKTPLTSTTTTSSTPTTVSAAITTTTTTTTPVAAATILTTSTPKSSPVTSSTKQTSAKKNEQKTPVVNKIKTPGSNKKNEIDQNRMNVRKTLAESLTTRMKETDDIRLTEDEIFDIGLKIEIEMYKYFRDTGTKYKSKYRSLIFNIKDAKNLTLFRKILLKSLTPDAVVRLSPDEMASQELAEWREKETQHQLEMIKKNELDLMAQAKSIVVKTHKGEQIIESDGISIDPNTPVQDIVNALNNTDNTNFDGLNEEKDETTSSSFDDTKKLLLNKKDNNSDNKKKKRDKDGHRSREKDHKDTTKRDKSSSRNQKHHSRDRSRDHRRSKDGKRDKDKSHDKSKDNKKEREKDRSRKSSKNRSKSSSKSSHKDHKDNKKKFDNDNDVKNNKKDIEINKKESSPVVEKQTSDDRQWKNIEDETSRATIDGNESDVSDREPSSTVNIKTPDINEESEKEKDNVLPEESSMTEETSTPSATTPTTTTTMTATTTVSTPPPPTTTTTNENRQQEINKSQTIWRGFVNMTDVARFYTTAHELNGHANDLMEDLPNTVDIVGRISHETVWDYIAKTKRTGSKDILVIRLLATNDEEKIPYITLYSYLNSRSRLGVVGNVGKNIKDFYIMPYSSQTKIPPVLVQFIGDSLRNDKQHLLLGIILRKKQKLQPISHGQLSTLPSVTKVVVNKKDNEAERFIGPPVVSAVKDKLIATGSVDKIPLVDEKLAVTQLTLNSLNKAHVGMSRNIIDTAKISKIIPELSSKLDLTLSQEKQQVPENNDDDEPYSPGGIDNDDSNSQSMPIKLPTTCYTATAKDPTELQRKMDELNRQIEAEKQQIQSISSSFLADTGPTLPGLGLDPPGVVNDSDEAYSPSDTRSFTPPPLSSSTSTTQNISKLTQPILDKVSDITIPANLQEILANVKRQENSKVDSYLPAKPGASFLTSFDTSLISQTKNEKTFKSTTSVAEVKENTSTLRSLSDLDLIKKAEEELAAVAAAEAAQAAAAATIVQPSLDMQINLPSDLVQDVPIFEAINETNNYSMIAGDEESADDLISEQPKPPGAEDDDLSNFTSPSPSKNKFPQKSGVVLCVKRKMNDDGGSSATPTKAPRTKTRWGQGPSLI